MRRTCHQLLPYMKTKLVILLLGTLFGTARAQSAPDSVAVRRNIVKINPLSLLVGDVSLFYERVLTRRASLVGGVGFGSETFPYTNNKASVPSPGASTPGRFHYERLTVEYRRYLSQRHPAPQGFYAGVYGRFAQLTLDDYRVDSQGTFIRDANGGLVEAVRQLYVWMPGTLIGWQATPKRMVIDLLLQYLIPTSSTPMRSITPELMSTRRFAPRYGFTVGYRL